MTHSDDHLLDARLRDMPTPAGIAARVAPEVLFDDASIDRLLVLVDLPNGLEDRTRRAMAAMREGSTLPLPTPPTSSRHAGQAGHGGGSHGVPSRRMRLWPAAMDLLADGGAVAAALSIVALMFFAGTELSRRLAPPAAVPQRMADRGALPTPLDAPRVSADGRVPLRGAEGGSRTAAPPAGESPEIVAGMRPSAGASPQPTAVVPGRAPLATGDTLRVARPQDPVEVRAAPAAAAGAGGGDRAGRAGGIRTVFLPTTGRQVPRVPAYDIAFEMTHGESPFIDPSRAAALAVDHPPLSLRTDSFDSLCEAARRDHGRPSGRRPRRGGMPVVRVEDVLAALPPSPPSAVGNTGLSGAQLGSGMGLVLSVDAVRSLRPSPGSLLVEVCATASPLSAAGTAAESAPLDAMLVLDQSSGPLASLSWQWLCRGLGRVIGQMGAADRLSLVVCGERPRLVALRADAATLTALLPELTREPMARFADLDAAFRLVAAVGRREGRPERIVAAVHADSLERCRVEGRAALSEWQAAQAAAPALREASITEFVLIDPQQPVDAGGSTPGAAVAPGRVAADPIAIGRAMLGHVFSRPTLVATGCRLEVAFDPARVGSYRIIGHRQTASDALAAIDSRPIDLHAGETVRVVYEVICRPGGTPPAAAGVVSATLAWTPAATGPDGPSPEQKARRGLADGNDALADGMRAGLPSPHGCELLLAVALGELTAASVHAEPWRQSVAEMARLVSRWQARGDLTPMGGLLIDCLEFQGVVPEAAGR